MNELRQAYRRFLNVSSTRNVEPGEVCDLLRDRGVLDDEDVNLIKQEPTLCARQYCLFLKILPSKGAAAKDALLDILHRCGYAYAANELVNIWYGGWRGKEVVVPRKAEEFYSQTPPRFAHVSATSGYHQGTVCRLSSEQTAERHLTYQGRSASQPPPIPPQQPPPPPPGWKMPFIGRFQLMKCAGHGYQRDQRSKIGDGSLSEPDGDTQEGEKMEVAKRFTGLQGKVGDGSLSEPGGDAQEGEKMEVAKRFTGLGAPPPLTTSDSAYGSASTDALTPVTFGESEPPFPTRSRDIEAVAEGSLKSSDVQLGREIGRGSYAVVCMAQHAGRKVAVKKFRDYDEFSLEMFIEEINIMKGLTHRNVVKFVGYIHSPEERQLWLITEFVPGGALRRYCTASGNRTRVETPLTLADKLRISVDCWTGLEYIHGKRLCHKDISPGNILVSNDLAQVKISDFGLAEFKNLIMTAVTQVSGTPMYYPPEFASEDGVIRHPVKSDIYSMGATLCELFSEQWFWNIDGKPRTQFQVMFMLSEHRRFWTEQGISKEPDCWSGVPDAVKPLLKDAITPDYKKRMSAYELSLATQNLLKQMK